MTIYKLSAANDASVEWSYFAQKCMKFHTQPSRFENFTRGEATGPLLTEAGEWKAEVRWWEGIKGFLPLKEGEVKG